MAGHICRCCGYPAILRAVRGAAELAPDGNGPFPTPAAATRGQAAVAGRPARPWDLTPAAERDYFELLGEGLVVVLPPPATGGWFRNGGAGCHIGPDGAVTAFTGKVDVGQDNRTALPQLVADELRVPFAAVSVVMGDTDVCPFDVGTFGSRSMVDAGSAPRAAAAGAREVLVAPRPGPGKRRLRSRGAPHARPAAAAGRGGGLRSLSRSGRAGGR